VNITVRLLKIVKKIKATIFQVAFSMGAESKSYQKLSFYIDLYLFKTNAFKICRIIPFDAI
jgi:hypothetical protein